MKIIHVADLHLGIENYGRVDPSTGMSTRLLDFLKTFDEVVEYALANDVDLVLFCGDAYKTRDPSPTHQREFAKRIKRLSQAGIQVLLVNGNHDLPNAVGRATSLEIFSTLEVDNVRVANRPGVHLIETKHGPIQVVAFPWVTRSGLLSRDDYKNRTLAELNERVQELIAQALADEVESLDPTIPAVLASHATVSGAAYGSEKSVMLGQDYVILKSVLANSAFDYVALGHIHRHQVLGNLPPVVYPGSLERIDFGEEKEEKGFVVVTIDANADRGARAESTQFEFVPVAARKFKSIIIDADTDDPMSTVLNALAAEDFNDAIVRVSIKISQQNEGSIREADIRRALANASYIASISKEVRRDHRIRLGQRAAEEMSPLESLEAYLQSRNTATARTVLLLDYGRKIIEG